MEKRTILAIVLSLLVIIIYQSLFLSDVHQDKEIKDKKSNKQIIKDNHVTNFNHRNINNIKPLNGDIIKALEQQDLVKPREIIINTDNYKAILDTNGAKITSWKLKRYSLTKDYENSPLKLVFWKMVVNSYKDYFSQFFSSKEKEKDVEAIDIIKSPNELEEQALSLIFDYEKKDEQNKKIYITDANDVFLNHKKNKENLKLVFHTPHGFLIEKIFTFYNDSYQIDLEIIATNLMENDATLKYDIIIGPGLGNTYQKSAHKYEGPITWLNGQKIKNKPGKNGNIIEHQGNISWTALTSNYFVAGILSQKQQSKVRITRDSNESKNLADINKKTVIELGYPPKVFKSKAVESDFYKFYFGPKEYNNLKFLGMNFEQVMDYGFFSFLAKPLIWVLNCFYKWIPNYGIAIILLTVLIKIIFWPLTNKSFRSMKEMQEMQPKLNVLKDKYKKDPKRLNEEIMSLYKQKGINPMGGCLPLLLQLPVFFALYEGLLIAIELRGAPFGLWIKDLSAMDPLLITPILMGITMYIQQKMTPVAGDATQVKMMMMMPLIFTIFFLGFPSGLVIYWLFNNLLTIGQHYTIMKKMEM